MATSHDDDRTVLGHHVRRPDPVRRADGPDRLGSAEPATGRSSLAWGRVGKSFLVDN